MSNRETLENKLSIESLTGLPQLQFDVNFRNTYEKEQEPYLIYSSMAGLDAEIDSIMTMKTA